MKLALSGGTPVRSAETRWPTWPVWAENDRTNLLEVLESGVWSYNGPFERKLIDAWKRYVGCEYALAAANGTVTLQLALEALDIGWGDEVIVPGLTWQATAAAVLDVNAVPILVDVAPDTWCIDADQVEAAITDRTKAIIVVHLYGNMPDMDRILEIATRHDLPVIEDGAHQHGSEWNGRRVGNLGTIGSFSLQLSKVLTGGEGGLLTTNDSNLWMRLDALRNCGRRPEELTSDESKGTGAYVSEGDLVQSGNYRITEFQAAVILAGLSRLDQQTELRRKNARAMDQVLQEVAGVEPMKHDPRQTRRAYFNYAFRYDSDNFAGGGIPLNRFHAALSAELNFEFESCYEPLNDCTLYRPLTKRRYKISEDHWKQIDPSRFVLPVCTDVRKKTSVVTHHVFLMGGGREVDQFREALHKIESHADELRS